MIASGVLFVKKSQEEKAVNMYWQNEPSYGFMGLETELAPNTVRPGDKSLFEAARNKLADDQNLDIPPEVWIIGGVVLLGLIFFMSKSSITVIEKKG